MIYKDKREVYYETHQYIKWTGECVSDYTGMYENAGSLCKGSGAKVIRTAYDCGINFFDHATCYGAGEAETRFSEAFPLTGLKREDIYIQSKCGIFALTEMSLTGLKRIFLQV